MFPALKKKHGQPFDSNKRHVRDLGNIFSLDKSYPTQVFKMDDLITLHPGKANIVGKSIVVHAGEDDLGRGGDEASTKTGNAGPRLACGIIRPI